MILIISKQIDISTDKVLRHLKKKKVDFYRFDLTEIILLGQLDISISEEGFKICLNNYIITEKNIQEFTFWFRKQSSLNEFLSKEKYKLNKALGDLLIGEFNKLNELFYQLTSSANWLCSPWPVNKPNVLYCAAKVGLHIPKTIITSSKSKIENHLLKKGRLLCKTLGDGFSLKIHNKNYFIAP